MNNAYESNDEDKKLNNIQIADNIIFSEDVNGVIIDGQEIELPGKEYEILLCLIRAKGRIVKQKTILRTVWGPEYDVFHDAHLISNPLKRLRKKIGDTDKKIIVTVKNTGLKLSRYVELDAYEKFEHKLPILLSNRTVPSVGDDTIIFRDNDLAYIVEYMEHEKNSKILLHGFGGVGKTSLARLLYENIKDKYDSTGWIEYHVNLKNSIVESIDFAGIADKDGEEVQLSIEAKWLYFSKIMKNTKERKLLIIDNVDVDYEINQIPMTDAFLTEITGWTNTDIVLTSRLSEIKGYHSVSVYNLGDKGNMDNCVALFLHYYKGDRKTLEVNLETVGRIVELAGFNTMIIELLAKSCVYEESVDDYYKKLKEMGFAYPSIAVMTMHEEDPDIALKQISNLFTVRKRKTVERYIVLCFRLLPEGEAISKFELENWLGFSVGSIDALVKEGWVTFKDGLFMIHPLIRQSFNISNKLLNEYIDDYNKEKRKTILSQIRNRILFDKDDDLEFGLRKLKFADSLFILNGGINLEEVIYIADYARHIGRRDIATKYYKMGYDSLSDDLSEKNFEKLHGKEFLLWKSVYYYGYLLSYTSNGMEKAEALIRESITIAQQINVIYHTEQANMVLAASYDHLGYILYNDCRNNPGRLYEAKDCLDVASELRYFSCNLDKENIRNLHDLAWTHDNIGCLLTKMGIELHQLENGVDIIDEDDFDGYYLRLAEEYFKSSLKVRRDLAVIRGNRQSSSEVAWTCCNLAACLAYDYRRIEEAERLFKESINIYNSIEKKIPGLETASLARTLSSYARAISRNKDRVEESIQLFYMALEINQKLEKDNPGIYSGEIDSITKEIDRITRKKKR